MYVDGKTENHELLQTMKNPCVQLRLGGSFSLYHRFLESYPENKVEPITWLTIGPTNPSGLMLVQKGRTCPKSTVHYLENFMNTLF